jgi:hypothetical protein
VAPLQSFACLVVESAFQRWILTIAKGVSASDQNTYRRLGTDSALAKVPGYAAFRKEIEAWEAERERESEACSWAAVQDEWLAACDAQDATWRIMVAFQVGSLVGHLGGAIESEQGYGDDPQKALSRIDSLSQILPEVGQRIVELTNEIEGAASDEPDLPRAASYGKPS